MSYSAEYRRNRQALMELKQPCYWCGTEWTSKFQADHLIEKDAGGDDSPSNLVSSCAKCNQQRGQRYQTNKANARITARHQAMNAKPFFESPLATPSKHLDSISERSATSDSHREIPEDGPVLPRLETIRSGFGSLAPVVVEWSRRHMGLELLDWQVHALEGLLEVGEDGDLLNRSGYVSVARQNGKSFLGMALLGAFVTDFARLRGKPQTVVNTASELSLACQQFEKVAPILKENFGFKLKWGYGRMEATGPDGSKWYVKAATPTAAHGLSVDFIWADEIWSISDEVLAQGLRPTMKARNKFTAGGSPLMLMTSTAGTEASTAQLRYREQGLKMIDEKKSGKFYFAEWSVPSSVDPMDMRYWRMANPSLGTLLQLEDMIADSQHPDRLSFLRASLNLFVAADQAWLQPGQWDNCATDEDFPDGPSWLSVDSSLDESRYVAVQAGSDDRGIVHVRTMFSVQTLRECQDEIVRIMEDPQVKLAITPSLESHIPQHLDKRKMIVGYGELLKYTQLVKNLIIERRIAWKAGEEEALSEHMARAVAVKQQHATALSSKRSPGPIELARCTIFASALAARPRAVGKAAMGNSSR